METKIHFPFNVEKAESVLSYIGKNKNFMPIEQLYKIIFYADLRHIKEYGRPILGSTYITHPLGIWHLQFRNMFELGLYDRSKFDHISGMVRAKGRYDKMVLSKSDITVLNDIIKKIDRKQPTIENQAYKKMYKNNEGNQAVIPYELFFNDQAIIDHLIEISHYGVL